MDADRQSVQVRHRVAKRQLSLPRDRHSTSLARRAWRLAREHLPLLASALVLAIATRPGSHGLLGLIALVPLFYTIHTAAPLTALIRGGVWGAAVAILLGIGVGESVSHWAAIAALPLLTGLYAGAGAALTRWIGFSPFVLGVGWASVEIGLSALGLDVGLLAATQSDGLLMQSVGRALGCILVAFIVAYANALLLAVIRRTLEVKSEPARYKSTHRQDYEVTTPLVFGRRWFEKPQPRAPPWCLSPHASL